MLDAVDVEQVVDETGHVPEMLPHRRADVSNDLRIPFPLQNAETGGKDRQRIAQLVRQHREKPVFLLIGSL